MRTIILAAAMAIATFAYGQNPPHIEISTEKVRVDGIVKYVHHVKKGETLYSLAKAYHVTIDEIMQHNETLKNGLKEGTVIFIPSADAVAKAGRPAAPQKEMKPVQEKIRQETAAAPQKAFEAAPQKRQKAAPTKLTQEEIDRYSRKRHVAKWYDTMDDIAARYKVTKNHIVAFNRLDSEKIVKKQVLYIPNGEWIARQKMSYGNAGEQTAPEAVDGTPVEDTAFPAAQQQKGDEDKAGFLDRLKDKFNPGDRMHNEVDITYILPLHLQDSARVSSSFMDFYAGSLLAANDLKNEGFNLNITLVDQAMYRTGAEIVSDGKVNGATDVVIGPARASDMNLMLPYFTHENSDAIIVSPVDQTGERLLAGNPNLIHIPTTHAAQVDNIVGFLEQEYNKDSRQNIVLICEAYGADRKAVEMAKAALDAKGLPYRSLAYGILEGRQILSRINALMLDGTKNLVLVPSFSEAFVSDVVRNLNLLCSNPDMEKNKTIVLFGTPKWKNFETIEVDYFHKMNLHLSLPYFIDYSDSLVKTFILQYRALYNCEPTPFAFQGYDITDYFARLYGKYGKEALKAKKLDYRQMLQSNYDFIRENGSDGMGNGATVNVIYNNDFTVTMY